jgi:Cell wall-active antibiotics response LiaF, C-terminal
MKRLLRVFLWLVAIGVGMQVAGAVLSKAFEGDSDPDDDEFRIGAVIGGRAIKSRATALRSIAAKVFMGGVALDLREATLAPGGAHLSLRVTAGGVRIVVPPTWAVVVADDVVGGAVEVDTTPPDALPADAPVFTVEAIVRSGGVMIEAGTKAPVEQTPDVAPPGGA